MKTYQQILLDFSSHFHHFFSWLSGVSESDYAWCIDELLIEILKYIDHAPTAGAGLEMLAKDVVLYGDYYGTDASIMVPAICWLAQTFLWELHALGLYDAMGSLHYEIGRDWPDHTTVVLVATN